MKILEDGTLEYTKEERIGIIEAKLLSLGYERDPHFSAGGYNWFKVYDIDDSFRSPVMVIDLDLNATLEFDEVKVYTSFTYNIYENDLFEDNYFDGYDEEDEADADDDGFRTEDETEEFISIIRAARKKLNEDLQIVKDTLNKVLTNYLEKNAGK